MHCNLFCMWIYYYCFCFSIGQKVLKFFLNTFLFDFLLKFGKRKCKWLSYLWNHRLKSFWDYLIGDSSILTCSSLFFGNNTFCTYECWWMQMEYFFLKISVTRLIYQLSALVECHTRVEVICPEMWVMQKWKKKIRNIEQHCHRLWLKTEH